VCSGMKGRLKCSLARPRAQLVFPLMLRRARLGGSSPTSAGVPGCSSKLCSTPCVIPQLLTLSHPMPRRFDARRFSFSVSESNPEKIEAQETRMNAGFSTFGRIGGRPKESEKERPEGPF